MNLPEARSDSFAAVYLDIRPGAPAPEPLAPLGPMLASGAAGNLYRHPGEPERVIKIYHPEQVDEHALKVAHMVALSSAIQPTDARRPFRFTWPQSCIVEQSAMRHPIGYSMAYLEPDRWTRLDALINAHVSNRAGVNTSYRYRVLIAFHLAQALETLHAHGIQCVDLKPANILIERESTTVALIDCDGMRFIDESGTVHPALLATPDYTAPEYQGVDPRAMRDPEAQDRFAFAVIAFQLLNMGLPPFSGIVPEDSPLPTDTAGKIRAEAYAYGFSADPRIAPNPRSLHVTWPRQLRRLFDAALGSRDRPEMSEWVRDLSAAHASLVRCDAGHDHFPGTCPFCHGPKEMPAPERMVPERRSRSLLFRFNLIAATLALLAVAGAWAMIFRQPVTPPPAPTSPVQTAQAPAAKPAPVPIPKPAEANAASSAPTASQTPAPATPAPVPQAPAVAESPPDVVAMVPAPLPMPRPAIPAPQDMAQQVQPMAPSAPRPPYSNLPYAQRVGLPQSALMQARWLDGRAADLLARSLDQLPDGAEIVDRTPGGGLLRGRLHGTSSRCRDMELYPSPRSEAAIQLRFCPDGMGRWIGQDLPRY
ncbi:hypothetical protein GCM10007301_53760 [Azorhizobium oxalatiphilum]|uniref:Protein kinase domain-containing protein n=1 Tax=Azorhizobium oxalatiphilum TaxID=980631 RepID=A0A917CFD0_9HYPH|nr:hypothetical protein [Azorhizobium oxalatiphilum]GGF87114.1 hypothetical protein GCM10007301_53760 [Azorhizobium oxalatiphilum]